MLKCIGFIFFMSCSPSDGAQQGFARFCQTYTPIQWHMSDSRETREQIKRENNKYKRLCGAVKK